MVNASWTARPPRSPLSTREPWQHPPRRCQPKPRRHARRGFWYLAHFATVLGSYHPSFRGGGSGLGSQSCRALRHRMPRRDSARAAGALFERPSRLESGLVGHSRNATWERHGLPGRQATLPAPPGLRAGARFALASARASERRSLHRASLEPMQANADAQPCQAMRAGAQQTWRDAAGRQSAPAQQWQRRCRAVPSNHRRHPAKTQTNAR